MIVYLAVLAVTVIDFFGHKRYVLIATALVIPLYLVEVGNVYSLTQVTIVENRPFEPTHVLEERLSGRYVRTTDGALYRLDGRILPEEYLLPVGSQLHIEKTPGGKGEAAYRLQSFGKTRDYALYEQEFRQPWITIPLQRVSIERYQTRYLGRVDRIDGTDWRAEERDMTGMAVSACCNADWFRELIAHGVDPRPIRIGQRNLLHVIADDINGAENAVETAAVLIEAGVDIDARDGQGQTPLYLAIDRFRPGRSGKPEHAKQFAGYVRLLLESGADPNRAAKSRYTPILEAVRSGYYEVSRMLLQHGADPGIEASNNGLSGYSQAVKALNALGEGERNDELQQLVREMEARLR